MGETRIKTATSASVRTTYRSIGTLRLGLGIGGHRSRFGFSRCDAAADAFFQSYLGLETETLGNLCLRDAPTAADWLGHVGLDCREVADLVRDNTREVAECGGDSGSNRHRSNGRERAVRSHEDGVDQ